MSFTFTYQVTGNGSNIARLCGATPIPCIYNFQSTRSPLRHQQSPEAFNGVSKVRVPGDPTVTHQIIIVMAVPTDGAMGLPSMLSFLPSIVRVRVKPMMAAFAVEYRGCNVQSDVFAGMLYQRTFA